jgi:hypothetical protein
MQSCAMFWTTHPVLGSGPWERETPRAVVEARMRPREGLGPARGFHRAAS